MHWYKRGFKNCVKTVLFVLNRTNFYVDRQDLSANVSAFLFANHDQLAPKIVIEMSFPASITLIFMQN